MARQHSSKIGGWHAVIQACNHIVLDLKFGYNVVSLDQSFKVLLWLRQTGDKGIIAANGPKKNLMLVA